MYRLTGVFATDANIFGGSAMLDLTTTDYSTEAPEPVRYPRN